MTLSDISIKRPVFAWMLMAGLIVFGGLSYSLMGISQLPDVDFPVITVTITWPGATPDVMESAVADIVEDAVMSVDGVQLVQSVSQEGSTRITIQFNLSQDINVALEEVQTRVSQAARNLPTGIDPPIITKTNPNDQPILWAAVYQAGGSLRDLALFVRDHLRDTLTTINGVGDVFMGGYVDPEMRVWMDMYKMRHWQITSQEIIDAINAEHQLAPTGYQDKGPKETFVRVHSEFLNSAECNALFIPSRKTGPIYRNLRLDRVAKCEEGTANLRSISRFNNYQPTIGLGVVKQHGTNAVAIAQAVRDKIKALKDILPKGMMMGVVTDTTVFIRQSVNELLFTLLMAVLLTSFVCYLFLGTPSAAFNVILAIPVSLIGSFIILHFLGFTINSFTLLGLSLSIGIVVDDAIMVLENITRHFEAGKPRVLAAIVGAREITAPALAASLAILAIFVPVIFMQGIVGKFFYQFGVTLSVAVMISLLEALTLAPMRCSQFLTIGRGNFVTRTVGRGIDALTRYYQRALAVALDWRWVVLAASLVLFAGSLLTIRSLRKEFLPPQDQSRFLVTLYTKMGSSLEYTDTVFKEAEKVLDSRPEVLSHLVVVGGFGGGLVNQGISFVTLKDPEKRPITAPFKKRPTQQEFMGYLRDEFRKLPGVERVTMLDLSLTGFSAQRGYPIEFVLQGPNWDKLTQLSLDFRKKLQASGFMNDVDSDYNPNMPETEIYPDRVKANRRGVTVTTIANTISAMVGGLRLLPNKYTDPAGHRDDIEVQLVPRQNQDPADIDKIWVRNTYGEIVPLKSVVTMSPATTLLTITRYNRTRGISIFGNFPANLSQSDVIAYVQKVAKKTLPAGYYITLSGSSQAFAESFQSLILALILGVFVAYIVLASQFNSFLHPFIILLALPFSLTGALWAMWMTGTSINIYSLIGILLLMGIVKKNSILLVEFTNHKRHTENLGVHDALLSACPIRLRPILMTSFATIAGAIPEAAALGPGAEIIRPMAVAVIGGVLVSTFLTLFVVPCAYRVTSRLEGTRHAKELREAEEALKELEPRTLPPGSPLMPSPV